MSSIKKNLVLNFLLIFTNIAFPLILYPHLTAALGVRKFGLISFVDSTIQYFILFASLGIPIYGIREISLYKENKRKLSEVFFQLFLLNLIVTAFVIFIFYILIFTVSDFTIYNNYFIVGSFALFFNTLILEWFYKGLEDYTYLTIRTVFIKIVTLISVILFVKQPNDAYLYYIIFTGSICLNGFLNFLRLFKFIDYVPSFNIFQHIRPTLIFFGTLFAVSVYSLLNNVLLKIFTNEYNLGLFSTANKISYVANMIIASIPSVALPQITRLFASDSKNDSTELIGRLANVVLFLSSFGFSSLFFLNEYILQILATPDYLPAKWDLSILSFLTIVVGISNILALNVLIPANKEKYFLRSVWIGVIIDVVLIYPLTHYYGHIGASLTLLITEIGVLLVLIYYSKSVQSVKLILGNVHLYALTALLSSGLIYGLLKQFDLQLFVMFAGCVVFSFLLYLFLLIYVIKIGFIVNIWQKVLNRFKAV